MKKKFTYNWQDKESYTKEEIAEFRKHLDGYLTTVEKEYDDMDAELTPIRQTKKQEKYKSLLPKNANADMLSDIISLSALTDEMDDETIKNKLSETVKARAFLQTQKDPAVAKSEKLVTTEPIKKEVKPHLRRL